MIILSEEEEVNNFSVTNTVVQLWAGNAVVFMNAGL